MRRPNEGPRSLADVPRTRRPPVHSGCAGTLSSERRLFVSAVACLCVILGAVPHSCGEMQLGRAQSCMRWTGCHPSSSPLTTGLYLPPAALNGAASRGLHRITGRCAVLAVRLRGGGVGRKEDYDPAGVQCSEAGDSSSSLESSSKSQVVHSPTRIFFAVAPMRSGVECVLRINACNHTG